MKIIKLALILSALSVNIAHATIFDVTYERADVTFGMSWTAVVNSTTNSMQLTSFSDHAGGDSYWTPTDVGTISFTAVLGDGISVYDVPDDWDGSIGITWGFLSDINKDDISWVDGSFTHNDSRLGWGFSQNNVGGLSAAISELFYGFHPVSAFSNRGNNGILLNLAEVTVSARDGEIDPQSPTSVPEAPTTVLLITGLLFARIYTRRIAGCQTNNESHVFPCTTPASV